MSDPGAAGGARRPARAPLDGILLLDKPQGLTSNAALQTAKRLIEARKAGHTGTLDPMATGLLPICFGEATKFAAMLLDADKSYEAVVKLGIATTTGDAQGEVTERRDVRIGAGQVEAVMQGLAGNHQQVPPMYSALKHRGRPLYAYARAGETVERAAREVRILALAWQEQGQDELRVQVRVSKGTYIRVLAEEIGRRLGCGAHLTALRRCAIGAIGVAQAVELAALEAMALAQRREALMPVDFLAQGLPALEVAQTDRLLHGQPVSAGGRASPGPVRLYDRSGRFLGLGEVGPDGQVAPRRLLAIREDAACAESGSAS